MDYKTGDILLKEKRHYFYLGSVLFGHALKSLDFDGLETNRIVYIACLNEYSKVYPVISSGAATAFCYNAIKSGSIRLEIQDMEKQLHLYTAALLTPHKASAKKKINEHIASLHRLIAAKRRLIDDGAAQRLFEHGTYGALKINMYYFYHYMPVTAPSFGVKGELINYHIVHILYYELATAVRRGIRLSVSFSPWFRDLINTLKNQIAVPDCVQAKTELCYQMMAYTSALSAPL
jgi:hypothetical protein